MRYYFLNTRERKILLHLAHIVLPEIPADFEMLSRKLLYHVDRFLQQLPPVLRFLFHLGAFFFNVLPLFSFVAYKSFLRCSRTNQRRWVCKVARTHFAPLYRWFSVARGLIMLVYYSQDEQHRTLAFSPGEWVKGKVIRRRRQLNLSEEVIDDPYSKKYHRQSH